MYQAIILGSVLLLTLYIFNRKREPKLNMPPLVRYKYPIIGHTFIYLTNCEKFLLQCRKEYGDIFSLYIWGKVVTLAGKEHYYEVLSKDDSFNFADAFFKSLPLDIMFKHADAKDPEIVKNYLVNKLSFYAERMQNCLYSTTQEYVGDCNEPKVIRNVYIMMTRIISNPIANMLVGEEESQYEEVIDTFANFTANAAKILRFPPFLDFIYPGLHNIIKRIILRLGYNPTDKLQKVLNEHIKRQVYKRLQEKEKYGNSWKRPSDLLQDIMEEESSVSDNINYKVLADKVFFFLFASVHSTSISCTNVLMALASRPEYMQELYEEQLEVHKEANENGILPFEALNNMKKLDSFIRETLRTSDHIATLPYLVLKDYTFSNRLQVPKDHEVILYIDDVYRDESLQGPNPRSFEPFRHVGKDVSAAKVGKNYLIFGGGKHACAGRQLAISEIKFFMHNIILKYNLRTESGKIERPVSVASIRRPNTSGIIFENRKQM